MEKSRSVKRNPNAELLRLVAICMIIFLHALDKGGSLVRVFEGYGINAYIAWFIEALSVPAVNAFMLLSGYYLSRSKFKFERLIELVAMTLFYSVGALLVCLPLGIDSLSGRPLNDLLYYFFPIQNRLYWFMTVYIVIYMLSPVINRALGALSMWQHKAVIVMLLIYETLFKSLLPGRFEPDERGFGFLWLLTVYIIGAYFRNYGFKIFTTSLRGAVGYIVCTVLIFLEELVVQYAYVRYGRLMYALEVSYDYNHILVLVSAVSLFSMFMNKKPMKENGPAARIVCALSPMALGVYLAHENLSIRYDWQVWLHINKLLGVSPALFVLKLVLAVAVVFACGLLIDFVRIKLFKLVGRVLSETVLGRAVYRFDERMNGSKTDNA